MQIAIGNSRMDKHWKNVDMPWEEFKERCSQTTRTAESLLEYKRVCQLPVSPDARPGSCGAGCMGYGIHAL